jgi:hypothetical protein
MMRKLTNSEINNLKYLSQHSIEVALIEPTSNGLKKSIFDATGPVRTFLKSNDFHDYSLQSKGESNKIFIPTLLIDSFKSISTQASLYRPETKNGDPRIWFSKIKDIVLANEIIGIIGFDKKLYVINLSKIDIKGLLESPIVNPLQDLINEITGASNLIPNELLKKLKIISAMGAVPAMLNADTAVGRTLENLLGIKMNSSRNPDYKGIELKSFRDKRPNRASLFSQVPDWTQSKFNSFQDMLDNFGYLRPYLRLYCTVSTIVKNSQGLQLELEAKKDKLYEKSDKPALGNFIVWDLQTLHAALLKKHKETFWIAATSSDIGGIEHFHFTKAEHTKNPIITQFDILLEQGLITVDHAIKKEFTHLACKEKGPFFKVKKNALPLLFPPSKKYVL